MRYGELARRLRRLGIQYRRQGQGSHEVWSDPKTKRYATIPNHPGREIAKGTLARILRDLGLTEDDLNG
jgi:predicted RNA binding protein YcfA (HicA-like mRNA interferase family)